MNDGALLELLVASGIGPELAARLARYGELVLAANRSINLTAAREPALFVEHIVDALTLAQFVDGSLIDIGSGAGLPGIPLALATGQPVVLVDSVTKKALFLRRVLAEFGLAGEALDRRAETLARDPAYRERFSYATARAVASASTVAELVVPFLRVGGSALLQRGALDDHERQAVTDAAPMLGAQFVDERLIGANRRILVLTKRSPTQSRFPRRDGVPAKRPLCMTAL